MAKCFVVLAGDPQNGQHRQQCPQPAPEHKRATLQRLPGFQDELSNKPIQADKPYDCQRARRQAPILCFLGPQNADEHEQCATEQQTPMQFVIISKDQRCNHSDKNAAKRSAGGNQQVELRQMGRFGPEPVKLTVANHAKHKQGRAIDYHLQPY